MGTVLMLAFFFPFYRSEYLLDWVLGSMFTFGAMIPMVFGSILAGLFFLLYDIPRKIWQYFNTKKELFKMTTLDLGQIELTSDGGRIREL